MKKGVITRGPEIALAAVLVAVVLSLWPGPAAAQTAPTITTQPTSQFVANGNTFSLSVSASGTAPLFYQWQQDGTNLVDTSTIFGSVDSNLVVEAASADSAGNYQVVVTNASGSVTSAVALVSVGFAPSITNQPASQTVLGGSTVALIVSVTGTPPLTYQWFDGTNLLNGIITTVAGTGSASYSGDGGPATNASLNEPQGVAVDGAGNLFIADTFNNDIRRVFPDGIIVSIAGYGIPSSLGDGGPAFSAQLNMPADVVLDSAGDLFIADSSDNRIRKVDTNSIITTVAGNGINSYSGDGGVATNAALPHPQGVAVDSAGNLFITGNQLIRKVSTNGIIVRVAGNGTEGFSGDGVPATNASLYLPQGVAVDTAGNLFIADTYNNRIRKVDTNGIIATVAGGGNRGFSGDGGPATNAAFNDPWGVAVDSAGNLFIADQGNWRIRRVDANGFITTVAGNGSPSYSGDGGPAANASLYLPQGVAVDSAGNLFIADTVHERIRRVTSLGQPALAFNNVQAANAGNYFVVVSSPYGSVTSAVATLTVELQPTITTQPSNQFVAYSNSFSLSVSAVGTAPIVYQWKQNGTNLVDGPTIFGSATSNLTVEGASAGSAGNYQVIATNAFGSVTSAVALVSVGFAPSITNQPQGTATLAGSSANFTVGASGDGPMAYEWFFNNAPIGIIKTVAGIAFTSGNSGDGHPATNATLNQPAGVAMDSESDLFIADSANNRVRRVDTNGIITRVAGNGNARFSGDGGPATNAAMYNPLGVAVDSAGNLLIADSYHGRVRKVDTSGIITTVAGGGSGGDGELAVNAKLLQPIGLAFDSAGNLFISDESNSRIHKVDTNGVITMVAGGGTGPFSGDGGPATNAGFYEPWGVAVDSGGNLFIADSGNNRVRKLSTNGIVTTVAGDGSGGYSGDGGLSTNAALYRPQGLAMDSAGNLFIADTSNGRIRKVSSSGIITTVAGGGVSGDGGLAITAKLSNPSGVAVDSAGNLFIADEDNSRVREVTSFLGPTLTLNNIQGANVGSYFVVVSSPYGSVTSIVVSATVNLPPLLANLVPTTASNPVPAVQLQFSGIASSSYVLQYTTNLSPPLMWLPLVTNSADTNGNWTFTDTNVPSFPARFFRMATP